MADSCCICGEVFLVGEVIRLTDEEMAAAGPSAEREVHYCTGCLRATTNLQQGPSILAGLFERRLRAGGVPGAEEMAAKFKQSLLQAATRKLQ